MTDVGLDRLLREEEALADLAIDEAVRDELENLDLARRGILADLSGRRWRERYDGAVPTSAATRGSRLETSAVVAIPVEDFLALSGVHASPIGAVSASL